MNFDIINPANGLKVRTHLGMTDEQASVVVERAALAQQTWRGVAFDERARLMAEEMGKPLGQGVAEVEKCAKGCDYYADNAAAQLAPETIKTGARKSFACFEPLGVVLAIMPWNYPFWQVFRFAAPTLMAGNAGLLKHAPNVVGSALAIESVFTEAGFPQNLFRTLVLSNEQTAPIIQNPTVRAVSLTGSVRAGKAVAAEAGAVLKKCVLELGGSDAYVVLEDADLDLAVEQCAKGRFVNSGQSCVAAKRFIVVEAVREEFVARMTARIQTEKLGDPLAPDTTMGPMARADLRDGLHRQVQASIEKGATCVTGGTIPERPGCYYPATLLTNVAPGMPAYAEELFGPVAVVIAAKDEADAIRIANDSDFGLGGAVFTRDLARGERLAREAIHSGAVFVNSQMVSDPRLPFGGIKDSGYGRELGPFGIREFVNVKTVSVA